MKSKLVVEYVCKSKSMGPNIGEMSEIMTEILKWQDGVPLSQKSGELTLRTTFKW